MKRLLLFGGAVSLLLSLGSCNLENSDKDNYQSIPYSTVNLVIPQDGEAFAAEDNYTLVYYPFSQSVTVSSQNLNLGVTSAPFTTAAIPYTIAAYSNDEGYGYFEVTKFSGGNGVYNGTSISNLSGYTSQLVYILPETVPTFSNYPYTARGVLVMNYTANSDYNVYTFQSDAVYSGNTSVVTLGGGADTYINNETYYRVVMHKDLKKADILFCNAKFNERMPSNRINFLVKDLDVTYTKSGYTITMPAGDEIIPQYYEAGQFGNFPKYRFTSFNFVAGVGSNLTEAQINFNLNDMNGEEIAARYNCSFNGNYVRSGRTSN